MPRKLSIKRSRKNIKRSRKLSIKRSRKQTKGGGGGVLSYDELPQCFKIFLNQILAYKFYVDHLKTNYTQIDYIIRENTTILQNAQHYAETCIVSSVYETDIMHTGLTYITQIHRWLTLMFEERENMRDNIPVFIEKCDELNKFIENIIVETGWGLEN